jgi:hypothetical protein
MDSLFLKRERYIKALEDDLHSLIEQLSHMPAVQRVIFSLAHTGPGGVICLPTWIYWW